MTRPATESERRRLSKGTAPLPVSNQRLVAAATRALEAHTRVRQVAARLEEELENLDSLPLKGMDPADPIAIAVEKVIAVEHVNTAKMLTEVTVKTRPRAPEVTVPPAVVSQASAEAEDAAIRASRIPTKQGVVMPTPTKPTKPTKP